jgi:hypothetical protein
MMTITAGRQHGRLILERGSYTIAIVIVNYSIPVVSTH